MIIVCDTNFLVSALIFPGGNPDKIWRSILSGRFQHASSPDILTELKRVLQEYLEIPQPDVESLLTLVTRTSQIVYPVERLAIIASDEADNRILECAVTAEAAFLVTGDKRHLIPIKKYKSIQTVSPADFVAKTGLI